jgi:cystathionine beta-synthase
VFNPVYAAREGWDHERHGQVRDVVFSRFPEGEEVVVGPEDPLRVAFMRMRAADVSQLPVVDGDRIVGLVDESDMLGAVLEGTARAFDLPVKDVMVTRLETISADAPIRELVPLFRRDLVATSWMATVWPGLPSAARTSAPANARIRRDDRDRTRRVP